MFTSDSAVILKLFSNHTVLKQSFLSLQPNSEAKGSRDQRCTECTQSSNVLLFLNESSQ